MFALSKDTKSETQASTKRVFKHALSVWTLQKWRIRVGWELTGSILGCSTAERVLSSVCVSLGTLYLPLFTRTKFSRYSTVSVDQDIRLCVDVNRCLLYTSPSPRD